MDTKPAATNAAILGVERSLGGRKWCLRSGDDRLAQTLSQRLGLPEVAGRVLAGRDVGLEDAEDFLNPTLKAFLPDPAHLKDMDKAVARLTTALDDGQAIGIFGDYDVDGATSSALLIQFFRSLGAETLVHIPDRLSEGYGPNAPALLDLKARGAGVVVTVDCGITAYEPLAEAAAGGVDMIVIDHHEAEPQLPEAVAVVNPNRLDDDSAHGHMAAVGVAFLLVVALNRALRETGWYQKTGVAPPDLMQWLDIVALGTVCDVVPLKGVNRALVSQGIKVLAQRRNTGLRALSDVAGIKEKVEAYHLGYILGPRINAGGRVGQADLGVRLLTTDSESEALALAERLEAYNAERREIEAAVLLEAMEVVEGGQQDAGAAVFAASERWHPGVVGIVASRLKERYQLPALVASIDGQTVKGSGRSVKGVDLGSAILAAKQAGLLINGGGHAMAAGFTVALDKVDAFRAFLDERLRAQIETGAAVPVLNLDGVIGVKGATVDLVEALAKLGPYGSGNAEPRFAISDARIVNPKIVGMGHISCILTDAHGGGRLKAIAFRAVDSDLGLALLNAAGDAMHLAGTLKIDTWGGRTDVQLFIEDAAPLSA